MQNAPTSIAPHPAADKIGQDRGLDQLKHRDNSPAQEPLLIAT